MTKCEVTKSEVIISEVKNRSELLFALIEYIVKMIEELVLEEYRTILIVRH